MIRRLFPVLALPALLARTLATLAVLAVAVAVFALAGFTRVFGEPQPWARALAAAAGVALLFAILATVALVRTAVGYVRTGRRLLSHVVESTARRGARRGPDVP